MALLFAVVVRSLVPHEAVHGASWWLNAHAEPVGGWELGHDGTLVFGTGGFAATSVLWSLRWEVLFSLFLPVFLLIGRRTRGMPWALAGVAFTVLALSGGHDSPRYMPAFLLGSLMAFEVDRLRALGGQLAAPTLRNRAVKATLVRRMRRGDDVGLVAAAAFRRGRARPARGRRGRRLHRRRAAAAAGLAALVPRDAGHAVGGIALLQPLPHPEPIVVAAAFALGGTASVALVAAIAVPVALLAAEGFFRVAERPMHRWSRAFGLWVEARVSLRSAVLRRSRVPDSA